MFLYILQVLVEHGELLSGILSKDTLGNKGGSLMHVVCMELGSEVTRNFYNNIQTVVNNYLMLEGHSIGIGDTIADTLTYNDIQKTIRSAKVYVHVCVSVYTLYMYMYMYIIILRVYVHVPVHVLVHVDCTCICTCT